MAKNIKKVGLLKDADSSKKPASAPASSAKSANTVTQQQFKTIPLEEAETKSKGKLWLYLLLLIIIVLVAIPKPELIVYRKMNIQASSIYWPGLFGHGAGLLDSHLQVIIDAGRNEMSLCFEAKSNTDCQTYLIERRDGLFGVIGHLLK
jgi:hypothetical protein